MAVGVRPWHADWALVGMLVPDASGATVDQALAFVPMSELSIEETWFVAGMKGTGSNTLNRVHVPAHRLYSVPRASTTRTPPSAPTSPCTGPRSSRC